MRRWLLKSPHGKVLELGGQTKIMGIINLTPDSFYDGGKLFNKMEKAVEKAIDMSREGAVIIDVGGESTRPGSDPIDKGEELKRVLPVIQELKKEIPEHVFISIDTYKSEVAEKAIREGADMINDISSFSLDKNMKDTMIYFKSPVVLMHMKGTPKNMQENPFYFDVVEEVMRYLETKKQILVSSGFPEDQVIIDPGIGFGKRFQDNLELIKNIHQFKNINSPILVGHSRKSFIGILLGGVPPEERLEGTLAITAFLAMKYIELVRVHDVKENFKVIATIQGLFSN